MAMTTRVLSVTVPVPDQDRALEFYRDVLGCEVRYDGEPWPGARLIEVVPPGSSVGIVLLPPDSEIPVAVRMATSDADAAYRQVKDAGVTTHNDGPITIGDGSPMFFFDDPFGNGDLAAVDEDRADAEGRPFMRQAGMQETIRPAEVRFASRGK